MARPHSEEENLVKRAADGETEAFGILYSQHLDAIYRYIYFRVGIIEESEDLTETVFLKAWEALPGYRSFGFPFSSWLYKIAHNIVVDFHRKQKHNHSTLDETELKITLNEDPSSTLSQVISKEEMKQLAVAVSRLPEDQQQIIVLRFIEGLSHKEISQIIKKGEGACRMLQHRALMSLNKLINNG
jgi:RNA polymerase sigma-70 factor (ECF subfamily)